MRPVRGRADDPGMSLAPVPSIDQTLSELAQVAQGAASQAERATAAMLHMNLRQSTRTIAAGLPATNAWTETTLSRAASFLRSA